MYDWFSCVWINSILLSVFSFWFSSSQYSDISNTIKNKFQTKKNEMHRFIFLFAKWICTTFSTFYDLQLGKDV